MYDKLQIDNKEYKSMNGEIIAEEYLMSGNPLNPESSFGAFIYTLIGGGFDKMDEMTTKFLNDCNIMSCSSKGLDRYFGESLNLPRPTIVEDGESRLLTDEEYAVYLYVNNSQLITQLDLITVFDHCMGTNDNDVYITREQERISTVDHLNYTSPETPQSNISKDIEDIGENYITNRLEDDETYTLPDFSEKFLGNDILVLNIPYNNWSPAFLEFLEDYISIAGNVKIHEVMSE